MYYSAVQVDTFSDYISSMAYKYPEVFFDTNAFKRYLRFEKVTSYKYKYKRNCCNKYGHL